MSMAELSFSWTMQWPQVGTGRRVLLVCHKNKWRDLWPKTHRFFVFVFWGGKRKHYHWSKEIYGPIRMFSFPPSKNKNKRVASLHHKSRHLFLWQTNRTSLVILDQIDSNLDSAKIQTPLKIMLYRLENLDLG